MRENYINVEDLNIKIDEALDSVSVTSAHASDKGVTIVNVRDSQMHSKATKCCINTFKDNFEIAEKKFIHTKLTLVSVPNSMADDTTVDCLREK